MSAYREGLGRVDQRRAEVSLVRARVAEHEEALDYVAGKRLGRIIGAIVGLVSLVALVPFFLLRGAENGLVALGFFGAIAASLSTAFGVARGHELACRLRRGGARRRAMREARVASALLRATDLPEIERFDPWPARAKRLAALEAPSLVLPLVFASFASPLLAHAVVAMPFLMLSGFESAIRSFEGWIAISAVIVGHAHVALAIAMGLYGRRLATTSTADVAGEPDARVRKDWGRIFWITTGVASVPGIIFLALPTILTMVTGVVVIPLMVRVARRTLLAERRVVEDVAEQVTSVHAELDDMELARVELVRVAGEVPEGSAADEELDEVDGDLSARRSRRGGA